MCWVFFLVFNVFWSFDSIAPDLSFLSSFLGCPCTLYSNKAWAHNVQDYALLAALAQNLQD